MTAATGAAGRPSNEAIVRTTLAALVKGDLAAARNFLADDIVYHLHAYQKTVRGADEFVSFLTAYYGRAKSFRSDIHRLVADGDFVAIQGREEYEMDGAKCGFDYASWVRLENGRIAEWSDYFDSRILGKQLKAAKAG
jgi:ketosteroid isomerase-like protein